MAMRRAVKKAPAKKAVARRSGCGTASRAKVKAGDKYKCSVCGLVVSVDETCGCVQKCDIICCDTQMKKKR